MSNSDVEWLVWVGGEYHFRCPCGQVMAIWEEQGRKACACGRKYQMVTYLKVTAPERAQRTQSWQ